MRALCGALVGLALAILPRPALASPLVELLWVDTTGTGRIGGSTIAASPGDVLTGELRVQSDAGISSFGLSLEFDIDLGDELDLVSVTELTPPGFSFSFTPGVALEQESSATQRGRVLTFEAATLGVGPDTFVIGRIVFSVRSGVTSDGADVFLGVFDPGIDGLFDNDGRDLADLAEFRTAAVDAVPEVRTGLLVALGIAGLALIARRRSGASRSRPRTVFPDARRSGAVAESEPSFVGPVAVAMLAAACWAPPAGAMPAAFSATLTLESPIFPLVVATGSRIGTTVGGGGASIPADAVRFGFVWRVPIPEPAAVRTDFHAGAFPAQALCAGSLDGSAAFPFPETPDVLVPDCSPLPSAANEAIVFDGIETAEGALDASLFLEANLGAPREGEPPVTHVVIPLSAIGTGGEQPFDLIVGSPALAIGSLWKTGELSVSGGLGTSAPHIVLTGAGADERGPDGAGRLVLASSLLIDLGGLGTSPLLATLDIEFAPEPDATLGFGAGLLVLARFAQRRA